MQTREMLDKYIRQYYTDWMRCSERWCTQFSIARESYDLLADVLESLCRKPESQLLDMLSCEAVGGHKLFFYVRKALYLSIIDYRYHRYRVCCPLNLFSDVQRPEVDAGAPDDLFDEFRIVEAKYRSDDFIDPRLQYNGIGRLTRIVCRQKESYGVRAYVRYRATTQDGRSRNSTCRASAIAFLAQNPPPRKISGDTYKIQW